MRAQIAFDGIEQVRATYDIDETTAEILKKNKNEDCRIENDICFGVTLKGDGVVGFGTGTEKLFGILIRYEEDDRGTVVTSGYVTKVPSTGTLTLMTNGLGVDATGKVVASAETNSRFVVVERGNLENGNKITVMA